MAYRDDEVANFVVLPAEHFSDDAGARSRAAHNGPSPLDRLLDDRRWRVAGPILGAVALLLIAVVNQHRGGSRSVPPPLTPLTTARSQFPQPPSPSALLRGAPWPHAAGACGAEPYLPIVSASALNELTGVQVWTGGQLLRIVDLDTGAVTAARGVSMLPDEYIDELATVGADTFALSARCDFTLKRRVIRTGADGRSVVIPISRQLDGLIADSDKAWGVDYPETGVGPTVMVALDGSGVVAVPVGIEPTAVFENTLVGLRSPVGGTSPEHPGHVVLFDLATRKLRADLGPGSSLTVGAGAILWIEDRCPGYAPCQIHRFDLTTGKFSLRNCLLPRDAVLSGGVVSQDGRLLGLDLQRRNPDPRFDSGSPGPPSDVAILHLDTGALDVVPGIELAPKSSAAITFSADSRWVVIALNEGEHGRVLVWRPGLAKPMDPSLLLPGSVLYQLPVALNGIG